MLSEKSVLLECTCSLADQLPNRELSSLAHNLFSVLDTAGQEVFQTMKDTFMKSSEGFLLVFSFADKQRLVYAINDMLMHWKNHNDSKMHQQCIQTVAYQSDGWQWLPMATVFRPQ